MRRQIQKHGRIFVSGGCLPALHRQRMEVDFIRLIEEKQQEN